MSSPEGNSFCSVLHNHFCAFLIFHWMNDHLIEKYRLIANEKMFVKSVHAIIHLNYIMKLNHYDAWGCN